MPKNALQSLEHLCVRSIVNHWDKISACSYDSENELISYIRYLPEVLLNAIKKRLLLSRICPLTFQDFLLLVCRPIKRLDLNEFLLSKLETEAAFNLFVQWSRNVHSICFSHQFVEFNVLSPNQGIVPKRENTFTFLLQSMPNVTSISFERSSCQDWMLFTVAKYCPNLKEFNVSNCLEVTDAGISALCDANDSDTIYFDNFCREDNSVATQSHGLTNLQKIWFAGTSTTQYSVVQILLQFPNLKLCSHPDLLAAIQFLYLTNSIGQLESLENFAIPLHLLENVTCNKYSLRLLCEIPVLRNSLSCLRFSECSPETDLSFLLSLQNLRSLTLSCDKTFKNCGLNLSCLAINCPNLKHLTLQLNGRLKFNQTIPAAAFHSLKSLVVEDLKPDSISASDAFNLLSRLTCVKRLHFCRCPWLSDKILEDILRLNPLRNAKHLTLLKTKLSVDGLFRIFELKNNLCILSVSSSLMSARHQTYFTDYIIRKNWNLIFKLHTN